MISALQNLNLLKLGTLFTLNFIGGFLIYASIFAAIGPLSMPWKIHNSL